MNISINRFLAGSTAPFLLLFLALVTFPRTTEAERYLYYLEGVYANAYFFSSSGSIETAVNVNVIQQVTQNEKPKPSDEKTPLVVVTIRQWDTSTSQWVRNAYGESFDPVFEVKSNLRSATVQATVRVSDWVLESSYDVTLNVSWTGIGAITRQSSQENVHGSDFFSLFKYTGTNRSAEAVGSAVIVIDPNTKIDFISGPSDPTFTSLATVERGEKTIFKLE